jgi:hypothetical protein
MNDREFGIWTMENLVLAKPVYAEIPAAGKLLPETSDLAVVHNALVLVDEFKRRRTIPSLFDPQKSGLFSDLNTNHRISLSRRLGGIPVPFHHESTTQIRADRQRRRK